MAITKRTIFILVLQFLLCCVSNDFNPKLVDYLKAERELRKKIEQNQGLEDSLAVLQKRFQIDANKEIAKIKNKPELWVKLLKAIDSVK
ncbi:MAG: hypothetical protein ACUVQ3_01410 [bacterium]